jgi:hypothetical protein
MAATLHGQESTDLDRNGNTKTVQITRRLMSVCKPEFPADYKRAENGIQDIKILHERAMRLEVTNLKQSHPGNNQPLNRASFFLSDNVVILNIQ